MIAAAVQPSVTLTTVDLLWIEGRQERWLRFGRDVGDQIVDRRRRLVSFRAGAIFAFVRWASNDFGTAQSRIDILRAVGPGEAYSTVPFVEPGGDILLRIHGWPKVQRVFAAIDGVETTGIDPVDVAPDYWRHVHNRLSVGDTPRAYGRDRHAAWLLRHAVQS
ncbi:DUF2840 domain-containing protein [Sphingomonas albertensis]|uniref:DUF2840 domain-containing protein n=1 Tax=Sphingomonas albertensis TaxID=2762591 RepID=A0ABR7AKZ2_9SPHN|nr:DUF2840 domain-containing protein [Sphingomonas albertensis]MBC3941131.1 DUF2840 domain-containing protein [Sphingomonas albertensis]